MDIFNWIEDNFSPQYFSSDQFIYEDMESQSGYSLPLIYTPFSGNEIGHWCDRGSILDFLCATEGAGKNLLDFGPGDGWPSLPLASYAGKVIGLDSSLRRVEICVQNARRLGIENAEFKFYDPDTSLPFADGYFDGATAASSIEQTPNPRKTLQELHRVLKPGGKLRFSYESLEPYRGGKEKDFFILNLRENRSKLVLFDRKIDKEEVIQYAITLALPGEKIFAMFSASSDEMSFNKISPEILERLAPEIIGIQKCKTFHPCGKTFLRWLEKAGFKEARMTRIGKEAAREIFLQLSEKERPVNLRDIDRILLPAVREIIGIPVAVSADSMITAVK